MKRLKTEVWSYSQDPHIDVRCTKMSDIPRLKEIFAVARNFMKSTGNPNQWTDDYPSEELMQQDIESGDSYVILLDDRVVATFVLRGGIDPTYNVIYGGDWLNNEPYATIHRIASGGEIGGVFNVAMSYALENYNSIRIDTHGDNVVMQHIVEKAGFKYCGIIHCWNGSERLAYQFCSAKPHPTTSG